MAGNKQLKTHCERLRKERHISQSELAEAMHVSNSLLSKYENGKVRWPRNSFDRYCDVLGLSQVERFELDTLAYGSVKVFDLGWESAGAFWEDVHKTWAVLRQHDLNADFGKVESEVIPVAEDSKAILRVGVKHIELHTSFTIQILNKRTNEAQDVLKDVTYPGQISISLTDKLVWSGEQAFTINLWISGKGKAIEFRFIGINVETKQ